MQWYLDLDDLPCESQCGNLNLFRPMGVSAGNDRAFFQWNSDYNETDGSDQHTRLYYTGLTGMPVPLTDEHWDISDGDRRGITDTDGTRVIYRYKQKYGDPSKLALVDVASKTSREIAWTSGMNGFDAHLSRSGGYVLVNGEYGDHGVYYQTLLELDTDTARDTWSYHFKMNRWGSTSNLTGDDRYYFYTIDGWPNSAENVGLYRIDTRTTGDDKAPYVKSVAFSAPALLDLEDETIAVQAKVHHPRGTNQIDSVTLLPLVAGQENPAWAMGREPLAFPSGDPGSVRLYDDGTHGDVTAGDGIYTFDQIATRKNGRQEGEWNTWYSHYPLPADVGIRVVVRDLDNNYAVADTTLRIIDDPNDMPQTPDDPQDPQTPQDSGCVQIKENLDLIIPCAALTSPFGNLSLSLVMAFADTDTDGQYIWKLAEYSEATDTGDQSCAQISAENFFLSIPCAGFTTPSGSLNLWVKLAFAGQNPSGDFIWRLANLGGL